MSEQTLLRGEDNTTELDLDASAGSPGDNNWIPLPPEQPEKPKRRRGVLIAAAAGLVLAFGSAGVVAAQAHKIVSLDIEGVVSGTSSWSGSVGGFLEENEIEIGEHDVVIPSVDSPLTEGTTVQVLRAQPINVLVDGEQQELWTVAEDAGSALAAAALENGTTASMVVTRSGTEATMDLPLSGDVRVMSMDGETELTLAEGTSLQDAIGAAGLSLGDLDEVAVTADADGTAIITIVRVAVENRVTTIEVPFTSSEVSSDSYYTGTSRVTTAGVNGVIEQTFEIVTRDGVVVSETMTGEVTTQEVVNEVVTVGTKARPVATTSSSSSSGTTSTVSGDVWSALAQCESGGNPSIVSSNGKYHGLYQFTVSTWQSVGGSGLPSQASASEQTERAKALQARSGWGQWPACARKLGLL